MAWARERGGRFLLHLLWGRQGQRPGKWSLGHMQLEGSGRWRAWRPWLGRLCILTFLLSARGTLRCRDQRAGAVNSAEEMRGGVIGSGPYHGEDSQAKERGQLAFS